MHRRKTGFCAKADEDESEREAHEVRVQRRRVRPQLVPRERASCVAKRVACRVVRQE